LQSTLQLGLTGRYYWLVRHSFLPYTNLCIRNGEFGLENDRFITEASIVGVLRAK